MPKRSDINKVLMIGSGPIQIGQAAEFDYSGSQACRALREEGVEVVLVNSNPATIMTDPEMADAVYIEPLTVESVKEIIAKERPDGVAAGLGGQTGLNLTAELSEAGVLDEYDVEVLGTPIETIYDSEDRERFRKMMNEIGEPVAESVAVGSIDEAKEAAEELGLPIVVRPAYTLGGSGGGIAENMEELENIVERGLKLSRINQVLIEESVLGWKEMEYEVMRDSNDTCLTVVNMENFDPMGVHTGESTVVAPSQTISDEEHQDMRSAAIKIIRELGIEGGCNIQFAINNETGEYKIVEVNPRVSRSSALASKATGYPIARVSAKIAIGMNLDEIPNDVTKSTPAAFEPTVDYTVVKIPRWPFDKFRDIDRTLSTQMKATGEVMAIGRNLEESIQKAIRSLDIGEEGFRPNKRKVFTDKEEIKTYLETPTDLRMFAIYDALKNDFTIEEVSDITGIDPFVINKIQNIIDIENEIESDWKSNLEKAKKHGFTDKQIAEIAGVEAKEVYDQRTKEIKPTYKMVDTCAAEFKAETPYFYSTYEEKNESKGPSENEKVLILGAGPIRIGQGIEFDYCCVHAVSALKEEGIETMIMNNNPETVSTDYDTSDNLFFDPLTLEDVMNVIESEEPDGVMVQFGGQTSVNLAVDLKRELNRRELDTEVYGTDPEKMDMAEDRDRFNRLLKDMDIRQPESGIASSREEALKVAEKIGYPLLVRPSYVLGGRAMEIVHDNEELEEYIEEAVKVSPDHPILIDQFIEDGIEIDVDAVSDGEEVLIGGIMEHIEQAGVHSGDSACVLPPQSIPEETIEEIKEYVREITRELEVVGLINIQMAVKNGKVYLLEANPRSSRTIPYVSKATGIPLAKIAAKTMVGKTIEELGYSEVEDIDHVAVKEVVMPFDKLPGVDALLGPEMKSTGEVMGIDYEFGKAFYKAEIAAENEIPTEGTVFMSIKDEDKEPMVPIARKLQEHGLDLVATSGTAEHMKENGIEIQEIKKVSEGSPNIVDWIREGKVDLIINTPTSGKQPKNDGYKIRRAAVDLKTPYITNIQAAKAAADAIEAINKGEIVTKSINSYQDGIGG
ncbi:carbamoyl-phosphate synthase large subunit [Methanonatronarchaeum sp. AMET6-2]|uniref:carbamoyl-phosphate synthase large subunit n=1 Tax=Methanonatronarchaeum sp. AMET6-2 TaxID=2933293 RepID=UPI0011F8A504|nr:carbamoyl-phosphate synthase large subunit [Methanonatronarchaeum sp. AMET6-2]RZN63250.1 MAG: carbamoyl-phosphate synthase large subunit [Methanonatronarchaeia archaeon]UOY10488.1 carbamoyl-phosphate synthase large subunit [Methanonatronarchaeum sp. AMET6-2]